MYKKKKLLETLDNREDLILKIAVFLLVIYLFIKAVLPTILDIPNCINGNYLIIEGTAQHNAGRNGFDSRVDVLDKKTQQIVRVVFLYKPGIETGDELIVQYVPHSGYGLLLEINGEKVHDLQ